MNKNYERIIKFAMRELVGSGNLESVAGAFSPDYVAHAGDKKYRGHSFIKRFAKQLRAAIPDLRVGRIRFLAQDRNIMTWQRTLRGTHANPMMGIRPSGKKVEWVEMVVTRFAGKKIVAEWVVSELMGELLLRVPRKK